jgi:uncharacterized protein YeaO (DUF488 family)
VTRTKRLKQPVDSSDGTRILITRYRPRGVPKGQETWEVWDKRLAPSVELLDAWYGKHRVGRKVVQRDLPPISWNEYSVRFCLEMEHQDSRAALLDYGKRSEQGEIITLLCYCENEEHCHRSLLKSLIENRKGIMKNKKHDDIIKRILENIPSVATIDRLEQPPRPLIGLYQPDLIRYVCRPRELIDVIIEVEASDFTGKDIPGACVLADNLVERTETVDSPTLAFVVPDDIETRELSHMEERLNAAKSRMQNVVVAPAMREKDFIRWVKQRQNDFSGLATEGSLDL